MRNSDATSKKLDINTSLITASQSRKSVGRKEVAQSFMRTASLRESTSLNASMRETNMTTSIQPVKEEPTSNTYYKDQIIIKYKKPTEMADNVGEKKVFIDRIEVCNEANFMYRFNQPKTADFWKTISYVQTCVKSKKGFGKEIQVDFYAPLDFANPNNEIKYDFRSLGDDVELLSTNEYKYCVK